MNDAVFLCLALPFALATFVACIGVVMTPRSQQRWLIISTSGPHIRVTVYARTPENAYAKAGLSQNDPQLRCIPLD